MSTLFDQDVEAIKHLDFDIPEPCSKCPRNAVLFIHCRACDKRYWAYCGKCFMREYARVNRLTSTMPLRCTGCQHYGHNFDQFLKTVPVVKVLS